MKILVVSDTHREIEALRDVVARNRQGLDLVIHLGDCIDDIETVMRDHRQIAYLSVLGNCDYHTFSMSAKYEGSFKAEGRRIFYTHGHKYSVKTTTASIVSNAKLKGCDIVLFGHSHVAYEEMRNDGILVLNPGSLVAPRDGDKGTYAILEINGKDVKYEIKEVDL